MYKPLTNFKKRKTIPKSKITIDCSKPVSDEIFDIADYESFMIKSLNSTRKNKILKNLYKAACKNDKVTFECNIPMSKKYIKMFTKRYLHKNTLKDFVRVISSNAKSYELRYYKISEVQEEEE